MTKKQDNESLKPTAELLAEFKESIIKDWTQRVLSEIPATNGRNLFALLDSIPEFIDHLCEHLSQGTSHPSCRAFGKEHGEQRANLGEYTVKQVIAEFRILRKTIFEALELHEMVPRQDRKIINEQIDCGVEDAAATFMHKAEEKADRLVDSLWKEREFRERFVSTMTHDLRNPLSAIKTCAEMILRYPEKTENALKLLERIVDSTDRMDGMILDLLDTSRVQAGQELPLHISPCDLALVVEKTVEEMVLLHGDRFVLTSMKTLRGRWDCPALQRVLENLIDNAVKYGSQKAPITIELKKGEKSLLLSVHNEGKEIPLEEQENLFKPYRRAESAEKSGYPGWGIGLSLVRGIAEAHGGKVGVESLKNKGTTFTVKLPLETVESL